MPTDDALVRAPLKRRRIVIFADGTGNAFSQQESNVWRMYRALERGPGPDGAEQIARYIPGVGTASNPVIRAIDGATGFGVPSNVRKLYRFLCWNWREGDEIHMIGFSRGAFTLRTLAGMIRFQGLMPRDWPADGQGGEYLPEGYRGRPVTEAEMKRMVGEKIFDAYYPDRYYNHDAEDPDGIVELERTAHNEVVAINRRAAESDLLIYVNINLVPMDGGHKSVGTGLTNYASLRAHHNAQTIRDTESYMEPSRSKLHRSTERIGRVIDKKVKVFHIETTINNRMFEEPVGFLMKKEEDFTEFDRLKLQSFKYGLSKMPRAMKRKLFFNIAAPYDVTGVFAGATEPTHEKTLEMSWKQYSVPVQGQSDIVIFGMPYVSPYNVNSILNPLLVQVMALGYLFNLNRGVPLVKKGGVIIFTHPCYDEFDPEHHAPYIEFFNRLLPETRDAMKLEHKYEREFATNPSYVHLYRKGHAYHGAHPFYMWYWGENGRQHVGKVIAAGADNNHVPAIMGWDRTDTLSEAIEEARGFMGRSASISFVKIPPILQTDVRL